MRALPQALLCALLLGALPARARADVQLEVRADRTSLNVGEALVLRISVESNGMSSPEIALPDFDGFQIVGQQVQRPMQFSFSFGARSNVKSSTIYTFQLQPTRVGEIVIGPVKVELDGKVETSRPLRIVVSDGGAQPQAPPDAATSAAGTTPQANASGAIDSAQLDPVAFVRTVVDRGEPWEGQQVTVTIYLYIRERMQSGPAIKTEPTTDGLWTHDLLSPTRPPQPTRQVVNGAVFAAYTLRRFAAFPLHAGEITIGPMALEVDTGSPFDIFNPGRANRKLARSGQPTVLRVKPLPEAGRPVGEVAVGRFEVETKLDRAQAVTGDAVTLTAIVRGEGNVRTAQLALPPIAGLEALAPEVKDLVEAPQDRVGGSREYRFLLVARAPGRYTLPPLTLATFDPETGRYATKQSAPLTLDVVGNPQAAVAGGAAPAAPDQTDATEPESSEPAPTWAPIRTESGLERQHTALHEHVLFPFALLLPPLAWLGAVLLTVLRRRAAARGATREGRAMREAEQHQSDAERAASANDAVAFHAAASAALLAVLEARLGEKVTGLTHGQLDALLSERGLDVGPRQRLRETLKQSDLARFGAASGGAEALHAELDAQRALYRSLQGFEPRKEAP